MYDVRLLQIAFVGSVGIRNSNIPQIPIVQGDLSESITGVWLEDKHPLVSTENIYWSAPDYTPETYPEWISGKSYLKNVIQYYNGEIYKAKENVTSSTPPPFDATNWEVAYPFQELLENTYKAAVSNLFAEIFRRKKLLYMGKPVLEKQELYRGFGNIRDKILPQGRFVGFEFCNQPADGLWVYIVKVGFQGTEPNPNMKFYLYHSDQQDNEGNWILDITKAFTFEWKDLKDGGLISIHNCVMKYMKNNTSGRYYFGYYESDLIGNALSKRWDCSSFPCATCDGDDIIMYNQWSRYTTIRNIQVPASSLKEDRTLFDTKNIIYDAVTNWGMNLSISVRCNLTDYFLNNIDQYTDPFAMQLCKEFLKIISNGCRLGPNPAQTKLDAIAALDEKAPASWIKEYWAAIDALNIDLEGFSAACLPKNNTKKIKFFSV